MIATGRHEHTSTHDHVYLGEGHARAERRTRFVVYLTAGFMVVEIVGGLVFRSMAVLADGVHMATHVGALGLAAGAYWLSRRHARNPRFTFGSGKFGDLAAFTSALILGLIGVGVAVESVMRLYAPVAIRYNEAIAIAAIGLGVNIVSALALRDSHDHSHETYFHNHTHGDHTHGPHADHNLRAAYLHVVADAATSVLALAALTCGLWFGLAWLDPAVGIVGAGVIGSWSYQMLRASSLVLLDAEDDPNLAHDIRHTLEDDMGVKVADLHLWRLGPGHRGLIVSLISPVERPTEYFHDALTRRYGSLSHVTVEITVCADCPPG